MHHPVRTALLLALLLAAMLASPVVAQTPVNAEPTCVACSISFRADVELLHRMPAVFGLQVQNDHVFIIQILPLDEDADPDVANRTPGMIGSKVTALDPDVGEIVAVDRLEGMVFPMGFGMVSQQVPDEFGDTRIFVGRMVLDPPGSELTPQRRDGSR